MRNACGWWSAPVSAQDIAAAKAEREETDARAAARGTRDRFDRAIGNDRRWVGVLGEHACMGFLASIQVAASRDGGFGAAPDVTVSGERFEVKTKMFDHFDLEDWVVMPDGARHAQHFLFLVYEPTPAVIHVVGAALGAEWYDVAERGDGRFPFPCTVRRAHDLIEPRAYMFELRRRVETATHA